MSLEYGPAGPRPHLRILASAGSGKTFQLSSRFLALVQRGAEPSSVLASTFSRAAAGEIRDRVLQRAARAVLEPAACVELARSIGLDGFDAASACALLETLVGALPRLQIRTIDSLFSGVVIAFAAELGLPPQPRILEEGEEQAVLRAAIGRALATRGADELLETLLSLAKGLRRLAVVPAIEDAVAGLLSLRADSAPDAWDWPDPPRRSEQEWDVLRAGLASLRPEKKSIQNAVHEDLGRLSAALGGGGSVVDRWIDVASTGLVPAIEAGRQKYSNTAIPDDVHAAYVPLCEAVRTEIRRGYGWMTNATERLLADVGEQLIVEKRQRGVVSFEDLTRALDPSARDLPALDEIWFRLDARIRHLMLDEFQDTGAPQWRALRPIAGEIAAHGDGHCSLFAVGDLKQSIYGWRGGEPGILDRLHEVTIDGGVVDFDERSLATSYRSSPEVIAAVNVVFGDVRRNRAVDAQSPEAARSWQDWWEEHSTARDGLHGFARFLELPPRASGAASTDEDDLDDDERRVRHAAEAAARYWRGSAAPGELRVAVLVRRNKMVGRVVAALQRLGVPAEGRGGGSLFDAEAVLATLQALRLAEWPDDTVAAFDLAHSPLADLVGLGAEASAPSDERRRATSSALRSRFAARGAAAIVDGWRRRLAPRCDVRDAVRMRQLVEVLTRLESSADRSPGELLALAKAARIDAPGGGGVTVMNVHQSKGLEFDVVVVTDLGAAIGIDGSRAKVAWRSPARPAEPIPRVTRWVKEELRWPEVVELHTDSQQRAVLESLCVLYVALTRARVGLEVHVDAPTMKRGGELASRYAKSAAHVVRAALPPGDTAEAEDGLEVLWSIGSVPRAPASVVAGASAPGSPAEDPSRLPSSLRVRARRQRARARQVRAASESAAARRFLFEIPDPDAGARGRALHACFELVDWIDSGLPEEQRLRAAVARFAPPRREGWIGERIREFHGGLATPAIRDLLTRPPGTDVVVRCEHRFVRLQPAGIQEGSIDRLVLHRDRTGRVTAADVIDFKTGADGDPARLAANHGEQLRAYRDVVVEQFGLPVEAVSMRIVAVESALVVDLPVGGQRS